MRAISPLSFLLSGLVFAAGVLVASCSRTVDAESCQVFCQTVSERDSAPAWNVVIYLDAEACLACNEDMETWLELEKRAQSCGAKLSLFAPRTDSVDVIWAMKLEGLKSKVCVLEKDAIVDLGWDTKRTPIKLVLDKECRPVMFAEGSSTKRQARAFIEGVIERVCSGQIVESN